MPALFVNGEHVREGHAHDGWTLVVIQKTEGAWARRSLRHPQLGCCPMVSSEARHPRPGGFALAKGYLPGTGATANGGPDACAPYCTDFSTVRILG